MAPFVNFVIVSSVLLVAKMAVNKDVYVIQSKIRGYHAYKNVWEALSARGFAATKKWTMFMIHTTDESKHGLHFFVHCDDR